MKFAELLELVQGLPWFDLATLVQLSDERRQALITQLHRFARAEKIVPLRRGMYILAPAYRQVPAQPAELANALHRPSYISEQWALSYHGVIPEGVPVFTSVTTRTTRRYVNRLGEFSYRNVKQPLFFGFSAVRLGGRKVLIATPEKALIDHWYLESGEWTAERLLEMRLAGGVLQSEKLQQMVHRIGKPRLVRALRVWQREIRGADEGEIEL
jgi:hypothetical protein